MKVSKHRHRGKKDDIAYRALRSDEWGLFRRGLSAPDEDSNSVDCQRHDI